MCGVGVWCCGGCGIGNSCRGGVGSGGYGFCSIGDGWGCCGLSFGSAHEGVEGCGGVVDGEDKVGEIGGDTEECAGDMLGV